MFATTKGAHREQRRKIPPARAHLERCDQQGGRGSVRPWQEGIFRRNGLRIVPASWDKTARIWDADLETMSTKGLARLRGLTKSIRDEMRLASYPDCVPEKLTCAGESTWRDKK
jgi:hypothetical protein